MHTRGLEANGSRITIAGSDKAQIIGSAYGLDEKMMPTPAALANARLWAGADDMLAALMALKANGCLNVSEHDTVETSLAKLTALVAIDKATIPATAEGAA